MSDGGSEFRRFEVTFYAPDEKNELVPTAKTVAWGTSDAEAAKKAYAELKPKHPDIRPGDWLAIATSPRGDTGHRRPS